MYGPTGAGVAEHLDFDAYMRAGKTRERIPRSVMDRVDIITGEPDQASFNSSYSYINAAPQVLSARPTVLLVDISRAPQTSLMSSGLTPPALSLPLLCLRSTLPAPVPASPIRGNTLAIANSNRLM